MSETNTGVPLGIVVAYAALAVWFGTLVSGVRSKGGGRGFGPFLLLGTTILFVLNVRYLTEGIPASIRFFNGIYDVTINLGGGNKNGSLPVNVAPCDNGNDCTVWGEDYYSAHSAWAVAFYRRFQPGMPSFRSTLLYIHIVCNTVAFLLMQVQLKYPGGTKGGQWHTVLGRISFISVTIGTITACMLASEHGDVPEYGRSWSSAAFYIMSVTVWPPAALAVLAIRRGDRVGHRSWMFRCVGAMWGAYWGSRALLLVLDPLLKNFALGSSLVTSMGLAGPLGFVGGELALRRADRLQKTKTS